MQAKNVFARNKCVCGKFSWLFLTNGGCDVCYSSNIQCKALCLLQVQHVNVMGSQDMSCMTWVHYFAEVLWIGLQSRSGLNFFQALISQLLKLCV